MSKFIIEGGHPLHGTITASGNKNAALALLPASLLTEDPLILHNIPDIQDVRTALALLSDLGVEVDQLGEGSWRVGARQVTQTKLDRT